MINIKETNNFRVSFLHLSFRPFFLFGSLFAIISMAVWFWLYQFEHTLPASHQLLPTIWHAHEMIYGYGLAIITGFLLTAAKNWTGVRTLNGMPLLLLAIFWLIARISPAVDHAAAPNVMMAMDILFNIGLCSAFLYPIVKTKQWKQLGIWVLIVLLSVFNILFYLGLNGKLQFGMEWGISGGLYTILSLILLVSRRVIPFFIERGVDENFKPTNRVWLDRSTPPLLAAFVLFEVFLPYPVITAAISLTLFLSQALRLAGWYTKGIWQKPLLSILFIAYGWIIIGFGLKTAGLFITVNPMLALHAFALGGIGLMTLGMMARVALGHTGRNVFEPPNVLKWVFAFMVFASLLRIVFPLALPQLNAVWVGMSQISWVLSFTLFVWVYAPILYLPRVDGQYG
ncbi:MAG: NnrS family protein [Gammaproteobacteria bacterium]|nr:NnrS family protein [Gammaproteobacteria bacterium]